LRRKCGDDLARIALETSARRGVQPDPEERAGELLHVSFAWVDGVPLNCLDTKGIGCTVEFKAD